MPIHIAPALVNRELAEEAAGLIQPINSDGYNQVVAQQNSGALPTTPVIVSIDFNGKHTTGGNR